MATGVRPRALRQCHALATTTASRPARVAMSRPQEISAAGLDGVLSAPAAVEPWSGAHPRHGEAI